MSVAIEGMGADWLVVRRSGGRPELMTFGSIEDLQAGVRRLLYRADVMTDKPPPVVATAVIKLEPTLFPMAVPAALPAVFTARTPPPSFDCQMCGACCASKNPADSVHVQIDDEDVAQIPNIMRGSLITSASAGTFLKTKKVAGQAVCSALSGEVGKQCKCGIYKKRPMMCRLFEVGSAECLDARMHFGLSID